MNTLEESTAGTLKPPWPQSRRATVFDIALLVELICLDLSPRDIQRCTRVCRSLFLAFHPHLVRRIYISRRKTHNRIAHVLVASAEQPVQASNTGEQENIEHAIDLTSLHTIETVFADTFRILTKKMEILQKDFDFVQELSKETSSHQDEAQPDMTALQLPLAVPPLRPLTRPCFRNLTTMRCLSLPRKTTNIHKNRDRLHLVLDAIDACPRLHTLELGFMDLVLEHRTRFLDMVRCRGRRLKQLKIRDVERYRVSIQVIRYLLWSCAAIESLTLDLDMYDTRSPTPPEHEQLLLEALARCALAQDGIREKDMDAFEYYRPPQEIISWSQLPPMFLASFEGIPDWHKEPLVFEWKELHIPYSILSSPGYLFDIYRYCPKLEALTMPLTTVPSSKAGTLSLITDFLPRLRSLDMHRLGDAGSDDYMVGILQSIQDAIGRALKTPPAVALALNPESRVGLYPGVQSLRISGTRFPLTNLVKLLVSPVQTFSQSLETLVLSGCWRLQSRELQLILTSCNHLKVFEAFTFEPPPPYAVPIWEHAWIPQPGQFAFDSKVDPILDVQADLVPVQTGELAPLSNMSSLVSGLEDEGPDTAKVIPMSWKCLKLRRLHLCYSELVIKTDKKEAKDEKEEKEEKANGAEEGAGTVAEPMVGIPRALWQQISRLEYLEELRLCRTEWSTENVQSQLLAANPAPASALALVAPALSSSSSSSSSPITTTTTTDPTTDTTTATQSICTRDEFRKALEDWDRSLTHLRRIQLRGLWHFVDPIAWNQFKKRNASRFEWARLR